MLVQWSLCQPSLTQTCRKAHRNSLAVRSTGRKACAAALVQEEKCAGASKSCSEQDRGRANREGFNVAWGCVRRGQIGCWEWAESVTAMQTKSYPPLCAWEPNMRQPDLCWLFSRRRSKFPNWAGWSFTRGKGTNVLLPWDSQSAQFVLRMYVARLAPLHRNRLWLGCPSLKSCWRSKDGAFTAILSTLIWE